MYNSKNILAIIPARGGSKGLLGKNIKILCGKPLIGWTIEQAKASKYIDEIFVSTDSSEIAIVSEDFGVSVPCLRPDELAGDTIKSIDVIEHVINFYISMNKLFDLLLLLEPTSPLRETEDIDNAIQSLVETTEAESIVSVCKSEAAHPSYSVTFDKNGFLIPYEKGESVIRRQDLKEVYFFEGSIYLSYVKSLLIRKTFYHDKTIPFVVPKWKSFEVDDIIDWIIIEALLKSRINEII